MKLQQRFPLTPYKIQLEFATALYQALQNNTKLCFMESPTGTGKTYSVLVPIVQWMEDNKFKESKTQHETEQKVLPAWLKASNNKQKSFIDEQKEKLEKKLKKINLNQITKRTRTFTSKTLQAESSEDSDQEKQQKNRLIEMQIKQQEQFCLPKIIFTSRTHTQLNQVVSSFIRLKSPLICISLASKNHLCIHQKISKLPNIESGCSKALQKTGCVYYDKSAYKQFFNLSVETALQQAHKYQICPYYAQKNLIDVADVICVPYSSLLSRGVRHKLGINIKNSIVVFDQGHNILEYDLNNLSKQIKYNQIVKLSAKLQEFKSKTKMRTRNRYKLQKLQMILKSLQELLKTKFNNNKNSKPYQKATFLEFLLELNAKEIEIFTLKRFVQNSHLSNSLSNQNQHQQQSYSLLTILEFLEIIIDERSNQNLVLFKYENILAESSIKILYFQPVSLTEVIELSKMTIITGGTLKPLDEFKFFMQKYQYIEHSFNHIIPEQNCQVKIIQKFNNKPLNFNFENKDSQANLQSIKTMLVKATEKTKEGIIVFIQNYNYLKVIQQYLKNQQLFSICYFDSKISNMNTFLAYQKAIKNKSTAILFSIMGGRLSEGINFNDSLARVLVIFGLPYANRTTPEMIERMNYYDQRFNTLKTGITGKQYYQNICMKTVNQTIGRAIRHSKDYATIYLVDQRFSNKIQGLSKWLVNRCRIVQHLEDI